jgi:hypothetical protein
MYHRPDDGLSAIERRMASMTRLIALALSRNKLYLVEGQRARLLKRNYLRRLTRLGP